LRLQGGHQGGTAPVADGDARTLRQALRDRTALPRHPRPPHDHTASAGRDPQPLPPVSGEAPPVALAIVGPTASGKTTLSIEVARRLDGEIVSMDSRQVYRGMDIGTAKATAAQRSTLPHHGLDLVDPRERFGAGRFAR